MAQAWLTSSVGQAVVATASPAPTNSNATVFYDQAKTLAGTDPVLLAILQALSTGSGIPRIATVPAPLMIFDNLAAITVGWVSCFALFTSDGIVLIDSLVSVNDSKNVIVPALQSLGADPATIKYVLVTHGHFDHYGGAQYFADQYGARVLMSPADWNMVATNAWGAPAPVHDLDIADGQLLTVGNTTISMHYTPGHTPGTVSPIFPVLFKGITHYAMLWGGTNPPRAIDDLKTYIASISSFRATMQQKAVDVELSAHAFADYGHERTEALRSNPSGPNPYVLGADKTQLFMSVMDAMLHGRLIDAGGQL